MSTGPSKALVMSFHGWTGVGKNFVAQFVADSLFDRDQQKKYVHLFTSEIHFPDRKNVDVYKDNIQVFIFNSNIEGFHLDKNKFKYLSRGEICVANFIPPVNSVSQGNYFLAKI